MREQVLTQAAQRSLQLADAMADQVGGLLSSIDLALQQLRQEWQGNPSRFDATVRAILGALPPGAVTHVSVADADGYIVYNSLNVRQRTYVGDRAHFLAQRSGADRLLIGKPVLSRLGNVWTFVVNRPILREGRFAGTMNMSVSSEYMSRKLASLRLSEKDVIALLHGDGAFMARSQDYLKAMGKAVPPDRPFLARNAPAQGVQRFEGALDGIPRFYAWRRLEGYGLITAIGLAEETVISPVLSGIERERVISGALVAMVALFGGVIVLLLQQASRKQAEIAANEAFRKRVFESSRVPIVVMDAETYRYIDCNPAASDIYRYASRLETLGKTPLDVSAPEQYDGTPSAVKAREYIQRALDEGSVVFEWRHRRPDGEIWDAEVHLMSFQSGTQRLLQFTLQDITERKRAEEALRALNQELEHRVELRTAELAASNARLKDALSTLQRAQEELVRSEKLASLGALVAGVAHELNTPLGNSLMVATTLDDRSKAFLEEVEAGELRRSSLNEFLAQTRKASELLTRNLFAANELISHFKQVAVDQTSAQRRPFDLAEAVDEMVLALQPQFRNSPHRIEVDIPGGIRMDSYPGPLGQVLGNLVGNAMQHAFDGEGAGVIRIEARLAEAASVRLSVEDNGRGIPPEHLGRIFDPFFTTRLGQGGSGLGLHIVYSIVTRVLGGRITVASRPGEGSVFTLELPLTAPEQGAARVWDSVAVSA